MKNKVFYIVLARVKKKHPGWTKERAVLTTARLVSKRRKKA